MGTTDIDGGEMAALADQLATAAREASAGRDRLIDSWGQGQGIDGHELEAAVVQFHSTWVGGTDAIAQFVQFAAQYTQAIANAYCAVDQKLGKGFYPMHSPDDMPKNYGAPPPPGVPVA